MFTRNCVVRCVGYRRDEKFFTMGQTYVVKDNTIVNDDGYKYTTRTFFLWGNSHANIIDLLSRYYTFELVEITPMECEFCGETTTDYIEVDGNIVCDSCKDDHVYFCDCCGRAVLDADSHYIDNETLCNSCFEDYYTLCDCCGEYVHRDYIYCTVESDYVCESCADREYTTCHCCGELVHNDNVYYDNDDNAYCDDCYEEMRNKVIHGYYYKPTPIFYGGFPCDNPLYMGVELEIDRGGERGENAHRIIDIVNSEHDHIYCKHDGSLSDGFEIVSHPMTIDYHINNVKWAELMKEAVSMGYRSHDSGTCGLHIHISRRAMGDTYEAQEETISKILYFVEKNWSSIMRFTRRTERQLDQWASRYGIAQDISTTYENAKCSGDRYHCVNLCNENTIEFRMFRGTLKHSTFVATLQLVYHICMVCKLSTIADIQSMSWAGFISRIELEKYPELLEYCKNRGLYAENV